METDREDLDNYQPGDFALFRVRETEARGFLKKAAYSVTLMTNEYYFGKYLKPRKRIERIQAEYPGAEKVSVVYGTKHRETADGTIAKISPENYEASIFHQLRVVHPHRLKREIRKSTAYEPSKSFSIVIESDGGREFMLMKLPTI